MNLNNSVRVRGGNGGEKLTLSRVRGIGFLEIIVGIRKTIWWLEEERQVVKDGAM